MNNGTECSKGSHIVKPTNQQTNHNSMLGFHHVIPSNLSLLKRIFTIMNKKQKKKNKKKKTQYRNQLDPEDRTPVAVTSKSVGYRFYFIKNEIAPFLPKTWTGNVLNEILQIFFFFFFFRSNLMSAIYR